MYHQEQLFLRAQSLALLDNIRRWADSQILTKGGFNPDQPRVPSGNSSGGQWTGGGEGSPGTSYPDAIEPVYPLETLLALSLGRVFTALQSLTQSFGDLVGGGGSPAADSTWTLGAHKSTTRWNNQMQSRGWTNEEITITIQNGKQYPAPNMPNPINGATRYENAVTGKFVVRDNTTNEILQISRPSSDFKPSILPSGK